MMELVVLVCVRFVFQVKFKLAANKENLSLIKIMYLEPDGKYTWQTGAPSAQTRTCANQLTPGEGGA